MFRRGGRSPYGERGLKSSGDEREDGADESLSLRRAWIEIPWLPCPAASRRSLSLRRAWIEMR